MKNLIKDIIQMSPRDKAYALLMVAGAALAIAGECSQDWKNADGLFVMPRLIRHHFSDVAAAFGFGGWCMLMKRSRADTIPKLRNENLAMVGLFYAGAYTALEIGRAVTGDAGFDPKDVAAFVLGAAMFYGSGRLIERYVPHTAPPKPR